MPTSAPSLIGLTGFRRCGKDSACQVLEKVFGFKRYGFADALRSMALAIDPAMAMHGCPAELLNTLYESGHYGRDYHFRYAELVNVLGYERAKEIPDVRRFLQRLGTEGVRGTFGPNAWVRALHQRIETDAPLLVCISDVRFASESDWILSQKGVIWRVIRPGHGGDDSHPSEVEIPSLPAALEIVASTLESLARQVLEAAMSLGCFPLPSSAPQ